jgi:hypothetical protein
MMRSPISLSRLRFTPGYYGFYSNAARGKCKKAAAPAEASSSSEPERETTTPPDGAYRAALRRRSGGDAPPRARGRPPSLPPLWRRVARGRVLDRARRDQAHPGSPPQARQALTLPPPLHPQSSPDPPPHHRAGQAQAAVSLPEVPSTFREGVRSSRPPPPVSPSAGGAPDPLRTGESGLLVPSRRCSAVSPRKATPYPSACQVVGRGLQEVRAEVFRGPAPSRRPRARQSPFLRVETE